MKTPHRWQRFWHPWAVALVFALVYVGIYLHNHSGDPDALVTPGSCYSSCQFDPEIGCPEDTEIGYDGQFAYYIARDPLHAESCIDIPAYRYQRILLPALGWLFSFGSADAIPLVFLLVNLAALTLGTALLEDLLHAEGVSRWYALVYGLFFGVVAGVRASMNEPLAYGLVIAAIWWHQRQHPWLSAGALLGAMLTKETTGLFAAGFGLFFLLHNRWKDLVRMGLVVGAPFLAWQLVLWRWLGDLPAGAGGQDETGFEIIPFNGFWRIFTGDNEPALMFVLAVLILPSAILPSLWGLRATLREFRAHRGEVHLYTCLLAANAAIMLFLPYSTYRQLLGIIRFLVGLVLSHVLFAAWRYPRQRPLIYSALWLVLTLLALLG